MKEFVDDVEVSSDDLGRILDFGRVGIGLKVEEWLSVVVTTNPGPTNPEVMFLADVVSSYWLRVPALKSCNLIVVCDGTDVQERIEDVNYRRGRVDKAGLQRYEMYKDNIEAWCSENHENACVLRLSKRMGFALAVREALVQVKTPYVMIVQHDRVLKETFDVEAVLSAMETYAFRFVNYVCLGTRQTWKYPNWIVSRFSVDVRDFKMTIGNGKMILVPLPFWFDSTHICRTSFYRDFALKKHIMEKDTSNWNWRKGDFVEDKLGQLIILRVRKYGMNEFFRYGTYLLCFEGDGSLQFPATKHSKVRHPSDLVYKKSKLHVHQLVEHVNQRKVLSLLAKYHCQKATSGG